MLKRNSVSGQNADNLLKLTKHEAGCCDGTGVDCQYTGSYTQANTVSQLTIEEDGQSVVLPLVLGANSTAEQAKAAILSTLEDAGYYEDGEGAAGVTVTDAGSTLAITIVGDIVVSTLTASGGTTTFTAKCVKQNLCTFAATGFTAGAGSTLTINGVSESIGDITPGTTGASTVKASVESALSNQGITATATVTTTGSGGSQTYNVSIAAVPSTLTLFLTGASAVKFYLEASACAQTYVA